jgi:hypothetical protein
VRVGPPIAAGKWCAARPPGARDSRCAHRVGAERARSQYAPILWHIGPSMQPAGLGERVLQHGYTAAGEAPTMGVALAQLSSALPAPAGGAIMRVRDRPALEHWAHIVGAGYGLPADAYEALLPVLSRMSQLGGSDAGLVHHYLAALNGRPVAAASLIEAAGVAGIFNVSSHVSTTVSTITVARGEGSGQPSGLRRA